MISSMKNYLHRKPSLPRGLRIIPIMTHQTSTRAQGTMMANAVHIDKHHKTQPGSTTAMTHPNANRLAIPDLVHLTTMVLLTIHQGPHHPDPTSKQTSQTWIGLPADPNM